MSFFGRETSWVFLGQVFLVGQVLLGGQVLFFWGGGGGQVFLFGGDKFFRSGHFLGEGGEHFFGRGRGAFFLGEGGGHFFGRRDKFFCVQEGGGGDKFFLGVTSFLV